MSAGALAATLAVAFVGGAGGAILGPLITGRQRRGERLADHRVEPYAHLVQAARRMLGLAMSADSTPEDANPVDWLGAVSEYTDAATRAEHVRSREIGELIAHFYRTFCTCIGNHIASQNAGDSKHAALASDAFDDGVKQLNADYDALRDQVQRETRG